MAYESTKIVKTLRFPGNDQEQYQINAVKFDGHTWEDVNEIAQRVETLESFDALNYKGVINEDPGRPGYGSLPVSSHKKGDVYKINFTGILTSAIDNVRVEKGDMIIANVDGASDHDADWDYIQSNIDVAAILDHTHTGTVELTKTNKTLAHNDVTLTQEDITASFKDGSATVDGTHTHTVTGTVKICDPTETDSSYLTPSGTVTVNPITPKGTLNTVNVVTDVQAANTSVSAHTVSESTAGGHTPTGSVTIDAVTPEGTVAAHKHNIAVTPTVSEQSVATALTATCDNDILTIGLDTTKLAYVSGVSATEENVSPVFTGTEFTPTATFKGDAVVGHTHSVSVDNHDAFVPSINVTKNEHTHTFSGEAVTPTATFAGTGEAHSHGIQTEMFYVDKAVTITLGQFTGNFTGSVDGTVEVANGKDVVKNVAIGNHTISTVDSASVTTGKGTQG